MDIVATAKKYLHQLQALLPSGAAWPRDEGAVLTQLLHGTAQEAARVEARTLQLVDEVDVRSTSELLPDWERVLGLPDDCTAGQALSFAERRRIAAQRVAEEGGQSRQRFIDLAALLGEVGCTVSEFAPTHCNADCNSALYSQADRFVWRVNIPRPASNADFATCNDDCNVALQDYAPSLIECPINKRKPAHTTVLFAYT